ncbi:MAG: IPT/TIG domain-containing protein [Candidatus Sericytochromatia bacterium]|nr:IPT/TIG domain-containing protein [Candidatus Sericytochromatia bacterium]
MRAFLKRLSVLSVVTAMLVACTAPGQSSGAGAPAPEDASVSQSPTISDSIRGTVDLAALASGPSSREVAALPSEIIRAATLVMIDPETNRTLSATVTRSDGSFDLVPPVGLVAGNVYVLEASKAVGAIGGVQTNLRVRTMLRIVSGRWTSISGSAIRIDPFTTAVALASQQNPDAVPWVRTMGKVLVTSEGSMFEGSIAYDGVSDADLLNLVLTIRNLLGADLDPVANIRSLRPVISGVSRPKGRPGEQLIIEGEGFSPFSSDLTVAFGAVGATIRSARSNRLVVDVPAASGIVSLTVRTRLGLSNSIQFTVDNDPLVVVSAALPAAGLPDTVINIAGSGFDENKALNEVYFGLLKVTPVTASPNLLIVKVPDGAATGQLIVKSPLGTSNPLYFQVPYRIDQCPTSGMPDTAISILGVFPSASGAVSFNGTNGTVLTWAKDKITVRVPNGFSEGALQITSGAVVIDGPSFKLKQGNLGAWVQVPGTYRDGSSYMSSWQLNEAAYLKPYYNSGILRVAYDVSGNVSSVTDVGGLGLTYNHYIKGGIVLGSWAYWFNDYSTSYPCYARRAPVANGVIGNFSYFQSPPTYYWADAEEIDGRLYLIDTCYGNSLWATINNDGTYGGWNSINVGAGDFRHGALVRVKNWLYRIGGQNYSSNCARAPIGNGGVLGSFSTYGSLPDNFYGASAVVVGKYLYAMASQANSWYRAEVDGNGNLGGWVRQAGGMPNTEYHSDRSWVKGDYVYYYSRFGLAQNQIID